ncbi:uncharacterized protein LOC110706509 [Chenopodium quinoa]|uniref:uncharacterized protein LOC110706509 n=1 Tax=Chenopodium quinoa TaxID=63459 RepID=UPI000B797CE8|nr:uncharacterized protein LOC110706509 [Chenopodium quinoa]
MPYQLDNWCLNFQQIHDFVTHTWQKPNIGSPIFSLSKKLDFVRVQIRSWCLNNKKFWGVDWKNFSEALSVEGEAIQSVSDASAYLSNIVTSKENILLQLQFWKQRCKKDWILNGECSTKLLFSKVKCRQKKNYISLLLDEDGLLKFGQQEVQRIVVHSLKKTFKCDALPIYDSEIDIVLQELHLPSLTSSQVNNLERPFNAVEIQATMFDLGNYKSTGPDDVTAEFFKLHWHMIGD